MIDVYEELGRLSAQEWDAYKSYVPGRESDRANPYIEGVSDGLERAQRLVEFLRWRSAREEWPAEGCSCPILAETPRRDDGPAQLTLLRQKIGGLKELHGPCWWARHEVTSWRYALGPCECAKEGK